MLRNIHQRFLDSVYYAVRRKIKLLQEELENEKQKSVILKEEIRQLKIDIGEANNRAYIAEFLINSGFLGQKFYTLFLEKVINFLINVIECSNKIEILESIADRCLSEVVKLKGSKM